MHPKHHRGTENEKTEAGNRKNTHAVRMLEKPGVKP
jgi:hypothetical protein